MAQGDVLGTVRRILAGFAERTGLTAGSGPPRRYLWTDAFAVRTFVELHRCGHDRAALDSALRLVDEVHATLGHHRLGGRRTGWLGGLGDAEGREYPTAGGLRIGKPLDERAPQEPFDESLEWERDGQYFHYLTQWMRALASVGRATDDPRFLRWAIELARVAHAGFTRHAPDGRPWLAWKMSIDLSRPLVPSMGQHDPLDGLLTFHELRAEALRTRWRNGAGVLGEPIAELRAMCQGMDWETTDPLGLGGLLADACRAHRLELHDPAAPRLLDAATRGLVRFARAGDLAQPAGARLAFRELGLALGLHAVANLSAELERAEPTPRVLALRPPLEALRPWFPLALRIEQFWLEPAHQEQASWSEHREINAVMLAASLLPESFPAS